MKPKKGRYWIGRGRGKDWKPTPRKRPMPGDTPAKRASAAKGRATQAEMRKRKIMEEQP